MLLNVLSRLKSDRFLLYFIYVPFHIEYLCCCSSCCCLLVPLMFFHSLLCVFLSNEVKMLMIPPQNRNPRANCMLERMRVEIHLQTTLFTKLH